MTDIIIEKTDEVLRLDVSKIPIGKFKLVPVENPSKSVAVPSSFQFLENPAEDIYTAKDGDPVKTELRDGDVVVYENMSIVGLVRRFYNSELNSLISLIHGETAARLGNKAAFNILDLAAAVQRGDTIQIVPKGLIAPALNEVQWGMILRGLTARWGKDSLVADLRFALDKETKP